MKTLKLLASGYGGNNQDTIGLFTLDQDGKLTKKWSSDIEAPSYLCQSEDYLFAASEESMKCVLYMFRKMDDYYELVGTKKLSTTVVCHIEYLKKSRVLLGSSYQDGSIFSIEVTDEGFGEVVSLINQKPNANGESRIHCSLTTRDERYIYVTNIADDRIYCYENDEGSLKNEKFIELPKGTGPRHLKFGLVEHMLYVISEYSNEIIAIEVNGPKMSVIQTISMEVDSTVDENAGASICVDKLNKKVYGSLRGSNNITAYSIEKDGKLEVAGDFSTQGNWPRHICLLGDGSMIGVANQFSETVALIDSGVNQVDGVMKANAIEPFDFAKVSFVVEQR